MKKDRNFQTFSFQFRIFTIPLFLLFFFRKKNEASENTFYIETTGAYKKHPLTQIFKSGYKIRRIMNFGSCFYRRQFI